MRRYDHLSPYFQILKHAQFTHSGVSLQQIKQLAFETNISFPASWIEWLQEVNGAFLGEQYLLGLTSNALLDFQQLWHRFPNWKSKKYIPVCGDGFGNFYVICTQQEYGQGFPIGFMDHEKGMDVPDFLVASCFEVFVELLVRKEVNRHFPWPFDENTVREWDPDLLTFEGASLPWQEGSN